MIYLESVKSQLTQLKTYLSSTYHVGSIGIFGSIVRDDFNPKTSDIDILVEFTRPIGVEFIDLANYIESQLKFKVDLVSKRGVKKKYLEQIESEIVYV
ncbi:MAG: nucleotidyltransferase domain-containing protein [Saprospiraceae bacterium]